MIDKRTSTKDKILHTACELFYAQGYNATGIQQIIDQAGVSKGAFYSHFKTKDELGLEYLKSRSEEELEHLRAFLSEIDDPKERYLQFTPMIKEWVKSTDYRGCAFANMSAEVPNGQSPIRAEAKHHYEEFRTIIKEMIRDLLASDPALKSLDLQYITDQFLMIQIGAIANAEIFQEIWPFEHAEKAVRLLINEQV